MTPVKLHIATALACATVAFSLPAGALAAIDATAATDLVAKQVAAQTALIKLKTESARWHVSGCVAHGSTCTSTFWMRFYRRGHRTQHCNGSAVVRQRHGKLTVPASGFGYVCLDG